MSFRKALQTNVNSIIRRQRKDNNVVRKKRDKNVTVINNSRPIESIGLGKQLLDDQIEEQNATQIAVQRRSNSLIRIATNVAFRRHTTS